MAVIKNFQEEKEARQQDNVDYREKIRAHKLAVVLGSVIGTVVLLTVLILINRMWSRKSFSEFTVIDSAPISVVSSATAQKLGESVLVYSKDGASCMDAKGKAIWNRSYEMQSPIVSVCNTTAAIGDYNGRDIYVVNEEAILGTVHTNLPIRAIAVSDNGVVATVLDDSDVIRIYVYDGNEDTSEPIVQAKATMAKSGYPISVSLSPNGKLMMVSYFYVDSGNMKSSVSFYNFGEVGSNKVDNFVSGFDYSNSVMPYVQFLDNDSAFGISDDRIVFFSGNEIPENVTTALLNEKVMGVYYSPSYVGLVFIDSTGEGIYRLDTYSPSGSKLSSIKFSVEYTDIKYTKDQIIIYGSTECQIFTVKGVEKYLGNFDNTVKLLLPGKSAYKYTLITPTELDMVELN